MQVREMIQLTDGRGNLVIAEITGDNKKKCTVKVLTAAALPPAERKIVIAISPLKNGSRFEWFLEKATEIGVSEIVPLTCERTGKQHFRYERMRAIIISAMLQSQQAWLPVLSEPRPFATLVKQPASSQKYIAHCMTDDNRPLADIRHKKADQLILIGPEGDFTETEIKEAIANDFIPVSLGRNRLRTETAGIVACTLLNAGTGQFQRGDEGGLSS